MLLEGHKSRIIKNSFIKSYKLLGPLLFNND